MLPRLPLDPMTSALRSTFPCISYNDNALLLTMPGATERRSRNNADHAPVEEPERSGPETLPDILTRLDVDSSGYLEDRFKVLLSFVKFSPLTRRGPLGYRPR